MKLTDNQGSMLLCSMQTDVAVDAPAGKDHDLEATWGDLYLSVEPDQLQVEQQMDGLIYYDELYAALAQLDVKSRWVLLLFYGFLGGGPQSLERVGKMMGLSRERIRVWHNQTLNRLRRDRRLRVYRGKSLET